MQKKSEHCTGQGSSLLCQATTRVRQVAEEKCQKQNKKKTSALIQINCIEHHELILIKNEEWKKFLTRQVQGNTLQPSGEFGIL